MDRNKKILKGQRTGQTFTMYLDKVLGKGSFGEVCKGSDSYGNDVAIKQQLKSDAYNSSLMMSSLASIKTGSMKASEADAHKLFMSSQNILKLIDTVVEGDIMYLILEFCDGGTLAKLISDKRGKFEEEEFLKYLTEIANGLYLIHAKGCIHRDLKPENILVKNGHLKISDLGLITSKTKSNTLAGTPEYMAPEIVDGKEYGNKADVYSLGVICFKMFGDNEFSKDTTKLIMEMLSEDPEKRPSVTLIMLRVELILTKDETKQFFLKEQINNLIRSEKKDKGTIIERKKADEEKKRLEEEKAKKDRIAAEVERQMKKKEEEMAALLAHQLKLKELQMAAEIEKQVQRKLEESERARSFAELFSPSPSYSSKGSVFSKVSTGSSQTCRSCGQPGHYANQCPITGGYYASNVTCYSCGERGHYSPQCPNKMF